MVLCTRAHRTVRAPPDGVRDAQATRKDCASEASAPAEHNLAPCVRRSAHTARETAHGTWSAKRAPLGAQRLAESHGGATEPKMARRRSRHLRRSPLRGQSRARHGAETHAVNSKNRRAYKLPVLGRGLHRPPSTGASSGGARGESRTCESFRSQARERTAPSTTNGYKFPRIQIWDHDSGVR